MTPDHVQKGSSAYWSVLLFQTLVEPPSFHNPRTTRSFAVKKKIKIKNTPALLAPWQRQTTFLGEPSNRWTVKSTTRSPIVEIFSRAIGEGQDSFPVYFGSPTDWQSLEVLRHALKTESLYLWQKNWIIPTVQLCNLTKTVGQRTFLRKIWTHIQQQHSRFNINSKNVLSKVQRQERQWTRQRGVNICMESIHYHYKSDTGKWQLKISDIQQQQQSQ